MHPHLEIDSLPALDAHLAEHRGLHRVVLQGLDLRDRDDLVEVAMREVVFLGCAFSEKLLHGVQAGGALVFPDFPGLPWRAFRSQLYTPEELYEGFEPGDPASYQRTLDARVYAHQQAAGGAIPTSIVEALARRIHDHSITDALTELLDDDGHGRPRRVVAVMGGHGMARGSAPYAEVAWIGRALARRGFLVATGGGPGAMEAAHVGAWFAGREDGALAEALEVLASAPTYKDPRWLAAGFEVRARWPQQAGSEVMSLGIPTWHYGHEPPNPFATCIAKYFENSVREEGLLAIATCGVVYSPGSAGTIQEVFQDACQNHYESFGTSPMIFLGEQYWTETKPVYPLLKQLAEGHAYARWLRITDDVEAVVAVVDAYVADLFS